MLLNKNGTSYKYPADENFKFQWSRRATLYENHICFGSKPSSVGTKVATVWIQHISKITMQFQSQLRKNNTLVLDPYFNSLCPWLVRPDRSKTTAVAQSTWMALKSQTTDSEDVQNLKQIVLLNPRSVCSWKKASRTPLEITTICLERCLENSHFSLSHSKASGLHKAVLQREVFGKLDAEEIVRHETLNLEEIYSWKASLKCTNNSL